MMTKLKTGKFCEYESCKKMQTIFLKYGNYMHNNAKCITLLEWTHSDPANLSLKSAILF